MPAKSLSSEARLITEPALPATKPFWLAHYSALLAGVYVVCGLMVFRHYQYKLFPDTTSYISIAQKYVEGDVWNAVNSYWAPLLSWAMVPFLALGFDPLQAIKLVAIGAGAATIFAAGSLFAAFPIAPPLRRLMQLALVPAILYFSMSMATPDLLPTALLTAYFAVIFRQNYAASPANGVLCGVLGGVAYLSKHYALPFFVIHFLVLNAWHYWSNRGGSRILKHTIGGLLACGLIAAPWVAAISAKYGEPTIGTSGARTHAYMGPQSRGDTFAHGLVAPQNPTAISAWEDPATDMLEPWSPFESLENFRFHLGLVLRNSMEALRALLVFSPISVVIAAAYIGWIKRIDVRGAWLLPFTMVLYTAGYVSILIEERYLWPLSILLMLMAGLLLTFAPRLISLGESARRMVAAACLGSFVLGPAFKLAQEFNSGADLYELATLLHRRYGVHGNIAAHNQYKPPLYMTCFIGGRFVGTSDRKLPEERIESELLEHDVDYYLVWTGRRARHEPIPEFLNAYREVTGGDLPELRVYAMKERNGRSPDGGNGGE